MDAADIAALDAAESSFQAQSGKKKMRITCKWTRRTQV
jgi:hypothetical protein